MELHVYRVGNPVILFRYDDELHCLARTVDDVVADKACYQCERYAVDNLLGAVEEDV